MKCPHCGERMPDGSDFCIACGNEIGDPTATQRLNSTEVDALLGDTEMNTLLDGDDLVESGASQISDSDSVFEKFMTDEAPSWDNEITVAQSTGDTANLFQPLEETYVANDVEPMGDLPSNEHRKPSKHKHKKRKAGKKVGVVIVALVACAAAVAVVALIVLPLLRSAGKEEVVSKTEQTAAQAVTTASVDDGVVKVNLDVPELGEDGSRVPIHVEGELRDGTAYAQDMFFMPGETNIRLPVGLYEISIPVSPINSEGYLYSYSDHTLLIAIGDDGSVTYDPNDFVFELEIKDSADTTYEDIDDATNWILKDPERVGAAEELANKARAKVDEANRKKEAESQASTESTTNNTNSNTNNNTSSNTSNNYTASDSTYQTNYDTSDHSYQDTDSGSQEQQSTVDDSSTYNSGEENNSNNSTSTDSGGSSDSGSQTGGDTPSE